MYGSVSTTAKCLQDYEPIVGKEVVEQILSLARPLAGARVLHLNSTAFGGGVAEILGTLVPLMNDAGLETDWQVIRGAEDFFRITKEIHNALQGMHVEWTPEKRNLWLKYNMMNVELFDESYDFVVVHDPQPLGILSNLVERGRRSSGRWWIWRCHIDLTDSRPEVWDFFRPYIELYDAAIFTMPDFVREDLRVPCLAILPPAIDPLSPKNIELPTESIGEVARRYNLNPKRPIICQVSRFDPWKDQMGVIDAYRLVKEHIPEVQLALVASMAADDPEGWTYYERAARHAGDDYDIHFLSNINGVGSLEVNALQRAASVIVQKSLREGFGLSVTEGLWKERPVVAGKAGGIPLQVLDGKTGFLVSSVQECAEKIVDLLEHPGLARQMGRVGKEHVRQNFLCTRYLQHYLMLFQKLVGGERTNGVITATARQ